MTNTPLRLATPLSLLFSLGACSGGDATETVVELEEGSYGFVGSGDPGFEVDSDWTIYAQRPLRFEMWIEGSDGRKVGGVSTLALAEGPCVYHLRYRQEEVEGVDLLRDVRVLGGESASDAVLSAVPAMEEHKGFRYSLDLQSVVTEVEREGGHSLLMDIEALKETRMTPSSSSSGWVPGSMNNGQSGMTTSMLRNNKDLVQFKLGEPHILGYWAELTSNSGSIGVVDRGGELSISYSTETQEKREVPLSEYEGRAWALKLTLTEAE